MDKDNIKLTTDIENENVTEEQLEKDYQYIQSLKNYDYVDYFGGEMWKPHRKFKDFKLTYKDLKIKKKEFDELTDCMESVWMFCDTIFLGDNAEEDDIHVLDYCFHGERIGWKEGDEYWLVCNFAFNRFEIRKADPNKWIPLEKMYVNKDLELRFKLGYIIEDDNDFRLNHDDYKNVKFKFIQTFGVNSFPDRIELQNIGLADEDNEYTNYHQILDYYIHKSSFCKNGFNKELFDFIYDGFHVNEYLILKRLHNNARFKACRTYNLFKENEQEDMNKVYETFLKYSHQLKFYQAHQNRKKK